jgi:hypothetical protein
LKANLGPGWVKKLRRDIQGYEFEVGVLEDGPHLLPVDSPLHQEPLLSSYAGGPVRRKSRTPGPETTGEVLISNMERLHTNLLLEPFKKKDSDIIKFTNYFLRLIMRRSDTSVRRVENLLQAVVRNPILKQEYGPNNSTTADNKGFDRHLFDTGQMFKAIKARLVRGGRR